MTTVLVLGGGVAGLTAAQELAERGFEVTVLESRPVVGGKARSLYGAPATLGPGPERYLESATPWAPGEHGFRFFPGFYRHVIDTMGRIPLAEGRTVADGLVGTTRVGVTQYDRPMFVLPAHFPKTPDDLGAALWALLHGISPLTGLTARDLAFFAGRVWQLVTSCPPRRLAELEGVSWWEFTDAAARSDAYRKFLVAGLTRSLVAAKAEKASARTVGDMFIQLALDIFDPTAGYLDRVLDGPTTDVWIAPWRTHLANLGVRLRTGCEVREIRCEAGRIASVAVQGETGPEVLVADLVVCALPVERAAPLLTPAILAADPALAMLGELAHNVEWMNGLQYFLFTDVPMVHGHMIHMDTEWALTSISQVQFWSKDWYDRYLGDVEFDGIVSVDVSDWNAPGADGRSAMACSPDEVGAQVWEQLKRSVNGGGQPVLTDENLAGWLLDPDIAPDRANPASLGNAEPLLVNYVDTWRLRPEAATGIANLFLAGDYVRTHTDLATMEAANESARRAVNAILDAEGHAAPRAEIWPLGEPAVFAPFVAYDSARFDLGMPWDSTLFDVAAVAMSTGVLDVVDPALAGVSALLSNLAPFAATPVPAAEEPDSGPHCFAERLAWYRDRALAVALEAVPDVEPSRYLYDNIREYVARPSKGLRPALCLATARAYGGDLETALPSAAGLEMLHNAFLVHDDIQDAGRFRRGAPALHEQIGTPLAINVGDAMNALAARLFRSSLDRLCPEVAARIVAEVDHLIAETFEGQAIELGWIRDRNCAVDTDDYLRLVLKKTAWYSFIHPMRIGALAAGGPAAGDLDRFNRLGFLLGAAFQIQDDLLNLTGSQRSYGKEIGGDLEEGKRTLVLSHALSTAAPADRTRLERFLAASGQPRLERETALVYDVLMRTGSIGWARAAAADLAAAAAAEVPVAFVDASPGPDLDFVRCLVDYVVAREV